MSRKIALLIGNDDYKDADLQRLIAPWDDVVALREALEDVGGFEIQSPLYNANLIQAQSAIARLFKEASPDDLVLLYYTGHGVRDDNNDLYFALPETEIDLLHANAVSASFVREAMQRSNARTQVVILDCCHSGAFRMEGGKRSSSPQPLRKGDLINVEAGDVASEGRYILTASQPNQSAYELAGKSIFTRHLVEGLANGSAAPEKEWITLQDLYGHVYRMVREEGAPQLPRLMTAASAPELRIARNPQPRRPIRKEILDSFWGGEAFAALGAAHQLIKIAQGDDPSQAEDAHQELVKRLEQSHTVPLLVAKPIEEWLAPTQALTGTEISEEQLISLRTELDAAEARLKAEQQQGEEMTAMLNAKIRALEEAAAAQAEISTRLADENTRLRSSAVARVEGVGLQGEEKTAPITRLPPKSVFKDFDAGPEMIVIPDGRFEMGSPKGEEGRDSHEGPVHWVRVARFALARTAVTFDQWQAFVDDGGSASNYLPDDEGWGRGDRPVINVSWKDAQEYIAWLNSKVEGDPYRLPSEAEWEYAARAETTTPFSFGSTISTAQANYDGNYTYGNGVKGEYREKTVPVGDLDAANAWGLRHMHGNVWEWVEDCWHDDYEGAPTDGSAWFSADGGDCSRRVVRGGSWDSIPRLLRSANRGWFEPEIRNGRLGFRPARTLLAP